MTTPYRELYVEPARPRADTELGLCPWCRARVEWRRGARRAVCGACGARYATAQALVATEEPVAPAERAEVWRRPRETDPSRVGPTAWRAGPIALGAALTGVVVMLAMQSGGVILWTAAMAVAIVCFVRRAIA